MHSGELGIAYVVLSTDENDKVYGQVRRRMACIIDVLKVNTSMSKLALGCGIGMSTPVFLGREMKYVGVDISDIAVEIAAKSNHRGNFVICSIADLTLPDYF